MDEAVRIVQEHFETKHKVTPGFGRYIRRPAIAVDRIVSFDGEQVVFRYHDKTEDTDKEEQVTVEEFISRLIRHIPDEQFKMIRHYGVYARRAKKMSKEKVKVWQETVKRTLVKVKQLIRRKWKECIQTQTGKDPMVCPKCECYYEYKGEVCLEEGAIRVKYASCKTTKATLERMIRDLAGIEETKTRKEEKEVIRECKPPNVGQAASQLCLFEM
ncbi:transposase [Paenibacillaceae bacterium WGS1546]|uniref:transposase n=1 Tax=Cohnella sp. WGS1546 TaxID=3366810 RepID=UPI00372D04CD